MRIGIDLMGGDHPPERLFPAVLEAATQLTPHDTLLVIATESVVDKLSSIPFSKAPSHAHIDFHIASEFITMKEDPLTAIRRKKQASLIVGIQLLEQYKLDAFVSCGNTGALISSAALFLPLMPGISRPALLVSLPSKKGPVAMLDVGGNLSCKAEHLVQFAVLGAAYQQAMHQITEPRVGLLNIGVESKKGTAELRQAYELLQIEMTKKNNIKMHFEGNVEARDVFNGVVDVLVTEGFTGNILLKTAEGVAKFIFNELNLPEKNSSLQSQFNYTEYPGAIICGVDRVVIKVHGDAKAATLRISILGAAETVSKRIIPQIKELI
ncbi:MAG: phosphate acyltransferase PlsX [Parachlamydiaceae bacterium]